MTSPWLAALSWTLKRSSSTAVASQVNLTVELSVVLIDTGCTVNFIAVNVWVDKAVSKIGTYQYNKLAAELEITGGRDKTASLTPYPVALLQVIIN